MTNKLELKFDPRTIEHLGIKMYSRIPSALAELIANAYDADSTEVNIKLFDNEGDNKRVIVSDNGNGMSFDSVNENFLIIGRKKREYEEISSLGRKPTGRKGLGKLALFGIGKTISITTQERDKEESVKFIMDWDNILGSSGTYHPSYDISEKPTTNHGTSIEVSHLKRTTNFDLHQIVLAIAKLFNLYVDDFNIYISHNGGKKRKITRQDRVDGVNKQFEWDLSTVVNEVAPGYSFKDDLKGTIISSEKPLPPTLRGITLYARGRQANEAGFFEVSEAGHTFSYLTGWVDADFIDDQTEDLISTDRQQVEWDQHIITKDLQLIFQSVLKYIVRNWSVQRSELKKERIEKRSQINVTEWLGRVPEQVKTKLESLIGLIESQPEIDDSVFENVIKDINQLIPEYTNFHYRYLHQQVKEASKQKYQDADYYQAFIEAMKRYKNKVKEKSGTTKDLELDIISHSFGVDKLLKVPSNTKRPNGSDFSTSTLNSIEIGNLTLARGIIQGGRNVISHEEEVDLKESNLFSEKDCLDYLSLLSHLFKRLDESTKRDDSVSL